MKRTLKATAIVLFAVLLIVSLASCKKDNADDIWSSAVYTADTTIGEGATTFALSVEVNEKTVSFTVNTNEETVGAALLDCGLIEGEEGAYGLYIKKVNGILADYDVNQTYWAFYINGEYAMTGVDSTNIEEGNTYSLVYEK